MFRLLINALFHRHRATSWAINNYTHLRSVVEHLQDMKLESSVIERVAYGNYARVLKAAMKS